MCFQRIDHRIPLPPDGLDLAPFAQVLHVGPYPLGAAHQAPGQLGHGHGLEPEDSEDAVGEGCHAGASGRGIQWVGAHTPYPAWHQICPSLLMRWNDETTTFLDTLCDAKNSVPSFGAVSIGCQSISFSC